MVFYRVEISRSAAKELRGIVLVVRIRHRSDVYR